MKEYTVYLNNASTTKPDKKVIDDFVYCAESYWHNPSDISEDGLTAKDIIKAAQKQIADSINAKPEEIIFTSGGSESNNWAIKGYVDNYDVDLIITTEIEHPSVYNTCLFCKEHGVRLVYTPVNSYGMVDLDFFEETMKFYSKPCEILVSIMLANNEIGTVQPIKQIAEIVHKYGGVLHVDAVQAYMHSPIDVEDMGIDMMSTSFHKFGGFKNCGFLYVRDGIELTPLIHGGHQFNSKRSGTENVPMIYAMGNQVKRLSLLQEVNTYNLYESFKYILNQVCNKCDGICNVSLNGSEKSRLRNNLSFIFEGVNADMLIALLETEGIYVSAGSACCSGEKTPSRILKAIGLSDKDAFSTIRVSINEKTTKEELDYFVEKLVECIKNIKIFELN